MKKMTTLMLAALAFAGASAFAADYPNKPVKLVVPFAPGGVNDILGRIVASEMSQAYGQSFVVDNRGGAGAIVGPDNVAAGLLAAGAKLQVHGIARIAPNAVCAKRLGRVGRPGRRRQGAQRGGNRQEGP